MTQFAMQGEMMKSTIDTLNKALFDGGTYVSKGASTYNDISLEWADKSSLEKRRVMEENDGLFWDGDTDADGILWGGCVESMIAQSTVGRYLPKVEDMTGRVLFLESSENIPPHWVVRYLLVGLGERGWFDHLAGVMIGRPKAWNPERQNSAEKKAEYRKKQREMVISTIREYNAQIPIVQNVDFGHTDPQIVLPVGGRALLSPINGTITLDYS
jgi:muramoyltetrapeptide carboxypeptidase LdcA involved in peptidoglycan recycling